METQEEFLSALDEFQPDLILSDFSLPTLDGYTALAIAQKKCPDVPFIFVSGTLGEETAIDTLNQGIKSAV